MLVIIMLVLLEREHLRVKVLKLKILGRLYRYKIVKISNISFCV